MVGPRTFSRHDSLRRRRAFHQGQQLNDAKRHLAHEAWAFRSRATTSRAQQRQQILEAARGLGVIVVPEGGALFQHNMSMMSGGTWRGAIPLANAYDDVLQFWATAGGVHPLNVAYGSLGASITGTRKQGLRAQAAPLCTQPGAQRRARRPNKRRIMVEPHRRGAR